MPAQTPSVKKNAVKGYSAEIIESGPTAVEQIALSSKITKEQNADFIHPFNDLQVITGAATCAL